MKSKICCFAGHSEIYDFSIAEKTEKLVIKLIEQGVCEFWVGNYGGFDRLASSIVRKLKNNYSHIKLNLIIPYLTKEITENKLEFSAKYDCILIADIPENTPKKFYIIKTNEYMINNSDYLICYVSHSWGGAYKTYEYAKRKSHIQIFNIGNI